MLMNVFSAAKTTRRFVSLVYRLPLNRRPPVKGEGTPVVLGQLIGSLYFDLRAKYANASASSKSPFHPRLSTLVKGNFSDEVKDCIIKVFFRPPPVTSHLSGTLGKN